MRKAIRKLITFFLCMVFVDFVFGKIFAFLKANAKTVTYVDSRYVRDSVNADIIVFGSSRSLRHYNPYILEDSMKLKCEVCGMNSTGITVMYVRFKQLLNRYNPKIVIYDVMPTLDVLKEDESKYIQQLRDNGNDGISTTMISMLDSNDKFKSVSQMYCNNSLLFSLILENAPLEKQK